MSRVPVSEGPPDIGCTACGHFACVCGIRVTHVASCKFRLAAAGAVGIECPHGYDVCPKCDPCTCSEVE